MAVFHDGLLSYLQERFKVLSIVIIEQRGLKHEQATEFVELLSVLLYTTEELGHAITSLL